MNTSVSVCLTFDRFPILVTTFLMRDKMALPNNKCLPIKAIIRDIYFMMAIELMHSHQSQFKKLTTVRINLDKKLLAEE